MDMHMTTFYRMKKSHSEVLQMNLINVCLDNSTLNQFALYGKLFMRLLNNILQFGHFVLLLCTRCDHFCCFATLACIVSRSLHQNLQLYCLFTLSYLSFHFSGSPGTGDELRAEKPTEGALHYWSKGQNYVNKLNEA